MIIAVSLIVLVGLVLAYLRKAGNSYDVDKLVSGITNQVKALDDACDYHAKKSVTHTALADAATVSSNRAYKVANKLRDLVN